MPLKKPKPWGLWCAIAIIGVGLINYLTRGPEFGGSYPVSVEIFVEQRDAKEFYTMTIVDRDACSRIIRVLCDARKSDLGDSPGMGWLMVHYPDGTTNQIHFLPGRNPESEGIRWGKHDFALSRKRFYDVLRQAGVDVTRIPEGEH